MQLYRSEETVHKIVTVINIILTIVLFGSIMNVISIPNWLRYFIYIDAALWWLYLLVRYMIIRKLRLRKYLESTYEKIQKMSVAGKNDFAMTDEARYYFEKVEIAKKKFKDEEITKYKTVLFGTEDPYIVTAEGEIIVKVCASDMSGQK